ncbi:MAG: P-II family nitrogen regulator [Nitrospirae bacterium]|nr:P-II family nitrogen regulator [Nitrospirota bacterium]MBI3377705.1 P-II family nitrogen regulator [Nitrospirota bacterium]
MKLIIAIIKTTSAEKVIKDLEHIGIKNISLSEVKGIGEQVEAFKQYAVHKRLEIIVPQEKAAEVSDIILKNAHTGLAGDGIIAVCPVDHLIKIRTMEKIK